MALPYNGGEVVKIKIAGSQQASSTPSMRRGLAHLMNEASLAFKGHEWATKKCKGLLYSLYEGFPDALSCSLCVSKAPSETSGSGCS